MPILVSCRCGKRLRVGDSAAGKRVKCPGCAAVLTVAAPSAPAPAVVEEDLPTIRPPAPPPPTEEPWWKQQLGEPPDSPPAPVPQPPAPPADAGEPEAVPPPAFEPPHEVDFPDHLASAARRPSRLAAVSSRTIVIGASAAAVLLGSAVWFLFFRGGGDPNAPPQLQSVIEAKLKVTGTAASESLEETTGTLRIGYRRWTLNLQVAEEAGLELTFGNDLFLIEASATGYFDGAAVFRGRNKGESAGVEGFSESMPYGLSNHQVEYTDGRVEYLGNFSSLFRGKGTRDVNKPEEMRFVPPKPGQSAPLRVVIDQSSWVKDEARDSLRVVLPEIGVVGRPNERYRVIVSFNRPAPGTTAWTAARQETLPLSRDSLVKIVSAPEGNAATRVLAANWLAAIAPDKAKPVLVDTGRGMRQGDLLATCLVLAIKLNEQALGPHAADLLRDDGCPDGIRRTAAKYIAAIKYLGGLEALSAAARAKEDRVADDAIDALSGFGHAAVETLAAMEKDSGLSKRKEKITKSLAKARGGS